MTVAVSSPDGQGPIAEAAQIWAQNGFSVVPIRADGSKRPVDEWKIAQERAHPPIWLRRFFTNNPTCGIAIVCGKVSGNLEMTELEGRATSQDTLSRIGYACEDRGVYSTWSLLTGDDGYLELTPSGGIHLLYRIVDHDVPGNEKIARRPATAEELATKPLDKIKVLAETRGEGGYVIVAPTGGTVHPTGHAWSVLSGRIGEVPEVTWDQRNLIHEAIRSVLDKMPELRTSGNPPVPVTQTPNRLPGSPARPGDDFNDRAEWGDALLLGGAGWTIDRVQAGTTYWIKPGADPREGHHATSGRAGSGTNDRLYVFSTATVFDTEEPISKFRAYAVLHHNGDQRAAARDLGRRGYGDQSARFQAPDYDAAWPPDSVFQKIDIDHDPESNVDSPKKVPAPMAVLPRSRGVRDYTLTGACVRFVDKWGCCIRYVLEEKVWRVWDGAKWALDRTGAQVAVAFEAMTEEMYAEAQKMLAEDDPNGKAYASHVRKLRDSSPQSALKVIAGHVTCSGSEFDANPRYLNLRNGVYDTVLLQHMPHDPKYMLTKTMGCGYNPDARSDKAEKFLADLMPDFQQRDYVMRALGYTLTGESDQRAFFLLHGLPGTGKSQFLEMMQDIFGDYGVTAMASAFHKRPPGNDAATPGLHELRGARFVTTSETSQDSHLDDELLKRLTGKDRMKTRSLYETQQEWEPQCTIWFATNHLPKFASDEDAVWRRVKTLPFVTQFSDDGSHGQLSEPNIGRKIAAEEADGILLLLINALQAYRDAGRLAEPEHVKAAVAEHRRDVDPVAQFVDDSVAAGELIEAPGQQTEFGPIYQAYCIYHKENVGQYPLGRRRFADSLRAVLGYDRLIKSNSRTYLPGWIKKGWAIGGADIGGDSS